MSQLRFAVPASGRIVVTIAARCTASTNGLEIKADLLSLSLLGFVFLLFVRFVSTPNFSNTTLVIDVDLS